MTRQEFASHIEDFYNIKYDCPFEDELDAWVFRHPDNKKWFALVMTIKKRKLGIDSDEYIDVVNLKCAPEIMDDLYFESGVFPAYHMSKKHWLTLTLDGTCDDETVKWITKISYDLTKRKIRKATKKSP
ncbi:MAG: MmcQ/YjbR family DNA-binding protein [Clostridia bacterium]|nr:MmcQ/YjbR family DNA-binding protein [Clostridia bacterium]